MRNTLAISAAALVLAALSSPSYAQFSGRGGSGGPSGGGFSQRSFQGPSRTFSGPSRSVTGPSRTFSGSNGPSFSGPRSGNQAGVGTSRRSFGVRPPAPGGNIGSAGNGAPGRSFRVQPPAPGGQTAGNGPSGVRRSFGVQPPAPGGQTAGNGPETAPRSFGVQPPAPAGSSPRIAQPGIGTTVRPPVGSPTIPSATTTAAVGTVAATGAIAATSGGSRPANAAPAAPEPTETAVIGRPIEPTAGDATTTAAPTSSDLPPLEMLASVGTPIMPVADAAAAATPVAGAQPPRGVSRVIRHTVAADNCGIPVHRSYGHRRHHHGYRW